MLYYIALMASLVAMLVALAGLGPAAAGAKEAGLHAAYLHGMPGWKVARTTELGVPRSEIPADLSRPQVIVEARLNGQGPFKFVLDTGAGSGVVLDQALAERLGLKKTLEIPMGDPSRSAKILASASTIDSVRFGDAVFRDVACVYWPHALPMSGDDAPVGVLSLPLFAELLLTFDFPASRITLARAELPPPDGQTIVGYDAPDGVPEIPVEVGGRVVRAHLDSGSSGWLMLPRAFGDSLALEGPMAEVGRARTVNSEMVIYGARLAGDVRLGGRVYAHPKIHFNDLMPMPNVGAALLRDFALTIDQKNMRVRFAADTTAARLAAMPGAPVPGTLPGEPAASGGASGPGGPSGPGGATRRYGIMMDPYATKGPLEVAGVAPGSPAERGGLQRGDVVLTIDGHATADMDLAARQAALRQSPVALTVRRGDHVLALKLSLEP